MARASRRAPQADWGELSLVLTDNAGIAALHGQFLADPTATDVITFRLESIPGIKQSCSGEIFVNVERAVAEGGRRWDAAHELALYIAHGCDHLSGATDNTGPERRAMRQRELRWVKAAATEGLVTGILPDIAAPLH